MKNGQTLATFTFKNIDDVKQLNDRLIVKQEAIHKEFKKLIAKKPPELGFNGNQPIAMETITDRAAHKISLLPLSDILPEHFKERMLKAFKDACIESNMQEIGNN